jgi:hypothetical protein
LLGVTPSHLQSTLDEYIQASASRNHAASLDDFADKPLVVLTAGIGSAADHIVAQNHLATLSTDSAHRTIENADHQALIADEQGAAATTRAILDVVQATRSHTSLR